MIDFSKIFRTKNRFFLDAATVLTGTALAQVASFALSPILTRLYPPDQFGMFAVYSFFVTTLSVVVCLCYETAVMLPKDEKDAFRITQLSILIAFVLCTLVAVAMWLFATPLSVFLKTPPLAHWLPAASLYLFALGVYQSLYFWLNRKQQFKRLSQSNFNQTVTTILVQILCGFLGLGVGGLIIGFIAGQLAGTATLLSHTGLWKRIFKVETTVSKSWELLAQHKNFPLFSSWGTLLNVGSFQIVAVLLSKYFDPAIAGQFFLAYRLINAPMSLIGSSIGQVFLQRSSSAVSHDSLGKMVENIVGGLFVVFLIPFAILMLFAPQIFSFCFGARWLVAGQFVQVLAPAFFMQFITSPVSVVLITLQKQSTLALIQALLFIGAAGSLSVGGMILKDPFATVRLYGSSQFVIYSIYLFTVMKHSSASLKETIKGGSSFIMSLCRKAA